MNGTPSSFGGSNTLMPRLSGRTQVLDDDGRIGGRRGGRLVRAVGCLLTGEPHRNQGDRGREEAERMA